MKLILSILTLISVTAFAQKSADVIVAQAGSKAITLEEFNKKYAEVKSATLNPPTKEAFLEDLVRYEIGVQEAVKRGFDKDPIVQEQFRQSMYKAMLEKDLGAKIQKIPVTEKDMEAYYKKNPELRSSHILIEFKPGATQAQKDEAKKRAGEIYDEVKKSKRPFEELVKLYSDDALSKQAGGDIGWQTRMTLVPNYYEALDGMKVGDIKGLIETQFGYHIVKLTGRRSFAEANKKTIRASVFDEKRKEYFDDYFSKLKKSYQIKENKSAIK
jgi:peptidyl-prolyl cis-trans isomerase C/peptidyl-prolyl cis-trans isomerase D